MSEINYNIPTNGRFVDISGRKFDRLFVESFAYSKDGRSYWNCLCDCGNRCVVQGHMLGKSKKSCGCLKKECERTNGLKIRKYNTYDLTGEYGIGWTSNTNEEFYFDLEDYDKIKDYCWSKNNSGYIFYGGNVDKPHCFLHRIVMNDIPHKETDKIDHINHNTKDNRKNNLRWCSDHENCLNRRTKSTNTSGQTNVCFLHNKWYVKIITKKHKFYQVCNSYEEACELAKAKRKELFKEYNYVEEERNN